MLPGIDLQQTLPLKDIFKSCIYVHVLECEYMDISVGAHSPEMSDPIDLELWKAMSYLTWVMEPELRSNTCF